MIESHCTSMLLEPNSSFANFCSALQMQDGRLDSDPLAMFERLESTTLISINPAFSSKQEAMRISHRYNMRDYRGP